MLAKIGVLFNGRRRSDPGGADRRYLLSPVIRERKAELRVVALARLARSVPGRPDAPRDVSTIRSRIRRTEKPPTFPAGCDNVDGENVPGVCHQLRAPRLPGALVSAIGLFMCPCHGGVYYADGSRASGPPVRGCSSIRYKIEQGNLLINAGEMPTPGSPTASLITARGAAMRLIKIGDWFDRAPAESARRSARRWSIRSRARPPAGLTSSAARRSPCSSSRFVTGILLALVYVPSAGEAWNSLQVSQSPGPLGWFIRALHGWGSNFMVAIVLIHMVQVFLFGAYKFPRELTWIVGVFLLLLTLGMAFTGQVLRFDQDAYWGFGIGASIVEPGTDPGAVAREPAARRADHRGGNAVAILRLACVRDPGLADRASSACICCWS